MRFTTKFIDLVQTVSKVMVKDQSHFVVYPPHFFFKKNAETRFRHWEPQGPPRGLPLAE